MSENLRRYIEVIEIESGRVISRRDVTERQEKAIERRKAFLEWNNLSQKAYEIRDSWKPAVCEIGMGYVSRRPIWLGAVKYIGALQILVGEAWKGTGYVSDGVRWTIDRNRNEMRHCIGASFVQLGRSANIGSDFASAVRLVPSPSLERKGLRIPLTWRVVGLEEESA